MSQKKPNQLTFGKFEASLADARNKRLAARKLPDQGTDLQGPSANKISSRDRGDSHFKAVALT
jgi:hypothetical protein